MRKILLSALFLLSSMATFAQVKWNADPAHSSIFFTIKHMGISIIPGNFSKYTGIIETKDSTSFQDASIQFNVDVNSVNTGIEQRDNHLKKADFFDVAKYPEIILKSNSFKKVSGNKYLLVADLTFHGVTKKVTFNVEYGGTIDAGAMGPRRAGFTAKATINRVDFGMQAAPKLPSGAEAVASEVEIIVNTEVVKQ